MSWTVYRWIGPNSRTKRASATRKKNRESVPLNQICSWKLFGKSWSFCSAERAKKKDFFHCFLTCFCHLFSHYIQKRKRGRTMHYNKVIHFRKTWYLYFCHFLLNKSPNFRHFFSLQLSSLLLKRIGDFSYFCIFFEF